MTTVTLGQDCENASMMDWSMDVAPRAKRPRVFSLHQANRSLVLLQRIVGDVIHEYDRLLNLEEQIEAAEQCSHRARLERARRELVASVDILQSCLEELDEVGVELRDFSRGIVDFPAERDGRAISYCWMYGEPRVAHWHEVSESFASRQPAEVTEDLLTASEP